MIAALSWCAELRRSTDAHQARLGMNYYWAPGRIRSILRAKRANLQCKHGRLPRQSRTYCLHVQNKTRPAQQLSLDRGRNV